MDSLSAGITTPSGVLLELPAYILSMRMHLGEALWSYPASLEDEACLCRGTNWIVRCVTIHLLALENSLGLG